MFIRKISLNNWRSLETFEQALDPGLNLLKGRNEAGKSSIVEAIGWALHHDLIGTRVKDEVVAIVPAHNSKAKPHVEVELIFPTCTAIISKTLAEDSAQRECVLVVRRPDVADECFDQGDAESQLKILMATDGATEAVNAGAPLGGDVMLSTQGASTRFVAQEFSSAARAAAGSATVGEDGVLALTSRLEKLRTALEKRREKELGIRLKTSAVEAARKQTDAARVRDELLALREQHAKYSAIESQIASLRSDIAKLHVQIAAAQQREENARRELEELRKRHTQQIKADTEVAELGRQHDEALRRRDALQRQFSEISELKNALARGEAEHQEVRATLKAAQAGLDEWQPKYDAAWEAHREVEKQLEEARKVLEAWTRVHEVYAARRERQRVRHDLKQAEKLLVEVEAKQAASEKLGRVPQRVQLYAWREQFSQLEAARVAARQTLQFALRLQKKMTVEWQADGSEMQVVDAAAGEEVLLRGGQTISVIVPGVGCFEVAGEGREARKQTAEIEAKARALEKQLKSFDISLEALPAGFEVLTELCDAGETAQQELRHAELQWKTFEAAGSSIEELRREATESDEQYERVWEKCKPLRALLPKEIKEGLAVLECDKAREREIALRERMTSTQRDWQQAFTALEGHRQTVAHTTARSQALEEAQRVALEKITAVEREFPSEQERTEKLDRMNAALYQAMAARDEAQQIRQKMGEAVTDETLAHAAHEAEQARRELHRLQTELVERRAELRGYCEQDPQTEIDRLAYEIENREVEVARHEARLRGLALLEAALEVEQHRLGRALSEPLNKYLSPWLSDLRGRETAVEFEENGGRISGIRTGENGKTFVLPFGEHSGGMQEQTALVLRLILAQLAAQKLPSGRLPIVLDDPLTQTDTARRHGLWRVLREAGEHLQIVWVTCHETHLPQDAAHHIALEGWMEPEKSATPAARRKPKAAHNNVAKDGAPAATPSLW